MNTKYFIVALSATGLLISGCAMSSDYGTNSDKNTNKKSMGKMVPPFGSMDDVSYAQNLWNKLEMMGFNSKASKLYTGSPPHGKVREVLEGKIDGNLIVLKRNYGGKGVSIDSVSLNRSKYLKAITVMAKRPGYDPDDKDWFWVKYTPDGIIMKNPKGMKLAGKVAKGMPVGCISCHAAAPGNDFLFIQDKGVSPKATLIGSLGM
ncbi:MAG: hypothetical protein QM482_03645 [Sulfurospirillum sp.]